MDNNTFEYDRKSEEDKKRQVLSLDDQHAENLETCKKHSLNLIAPPFQEEKSAKTPGKRVEFYRMVKLLKAKQAKNIVCWAANRLARNIPDGAEIIELVQKHEVKIYTPYTIYDSNNWFMLLMEFGMATDYSLKLSKDVKRGLGSKVKKGYRPGLAPIGYLNVGETKGEKTIEPDPVRFDLCKTWWQLMLTGKYTVLESLEVISSPPYSLRDRRGDPVSKTQAFKFFHNIFYAKKFVYNGEIHDGAHQQMITLDQFERVQHIITGKFSGRYEQPRVVHQPLPLSGFIKCGECHSTISCDQRVRLNKNGTTREFIYYRCKKNKGTKCEQSYMKVEGLDNEVRHYINDLELKPDFAEWIRDVLKRRNKDEYNYDLKQRELGTKRLEDIRKRKFELNDMKVDGLFTEEEYKQEVVKIVNEENQIKELLSSDRSDYWAEVIDETLKFSTEMMEIFNGDNLIAKRLVLQILGADFILQDQKLFIEVKGAFVFLRNTQNELFAKQNQGVLNSEAKYDSTVSNFSFGAGEGSRTPCVHFGKVAFYR